MAQLSHTHFPVEIPANISTTDELYSERNSNVVLPDYEADRMTWDLRMQCGARKIASQAQEHLSQTSLASSRELYVVNPTYLNGPFTVASNKSVRINISCTIHITTNKLISANYYNCAT